MGNETRQALQVATAMLKQRYDALNQLVEISMEMNSTLKLKPLLASIMQASTEITEAEAASILLVDQHTQDLVFAASTGPGSENIIGMNVPLDSSIAGKIIAKDKAIIIDDVAKDPSHFQGVDKKIEFETRSILGVPMRIRDKLIGVLEVLNKRVNKFNEEDMRHITILATQAAIAIDNAQLVEQLREAYEDLEQINKIKSDFIKITSHELRTPLAVVLGYAEFLKEDASGEAREHVQSLMESALHLQRLIESMTNLRYVQIDQSELKMEETTINEILDNVYMQTSKLASATNQIYEYPPVKKTYSVIADPDKLGMALTNLVNNAISYTPAGGIILLNLEEHGDEVWVIVSDNGVGIAKANLERIFDQFYQAEDPMTRKSEGLGLGLAIAKAVVTRHEGRIWAHSPGRDEGSKFTCAIPLKGTKKKLSLDRSRLSGTRPLDSLLS